MAASLKVRGTPYRHCFAILPVSIRDKIISQSTGSSLSGSIVLKLKWSLNNNEKTSFVGCRGDQTCEEGYIDIPTNVLQCINLSENIMISVTYLSSMTSYSTTQKFDSVSLQPLTYEDWEIIQYNADYVRDHLLEQIDVINDKAPFPIYIGDIKVHLRINESMYDKIGWGFLKLGRDTTIDIKPLKRTAKKTTNKNKNFMDYNNNNRMDDTLSEITGHTHSTSPSNYIQHPSFYETKEIESKSPSKDEVKDEIMSSILDGDDLKEEEEELCNIFRVGSLKKYLDDIAPIPPNVIFVSPNILENDSDDDDDNDNDDDEDKYNMHRNGYIKQESIAPSVWDGFYEGEYVIVTFRTSQSFVDIKQNNNNDQDEKKSENDGDDIIEYKSISMQLITCDYIENDEIILFSEFDTNCYGITVGDYCVIEPIELNKNCKNIEAVSPLNDSHFITIHCQQLLLVSSNAITSCTDFVNEKNQWNETSMLYLDNSFKEKLTEFIKTKLKNICNHCIIEYLDDDNSQQTKQYFYITLNANSSQLKQELENEEVLALISTDKITSKQVCIEHVNKCCSMINHSLLPPLDDKLIENISNHIISQFNGINNTYPSHTMIYGNDIRMRLEYISKLLYVVEKTSEYPISFIHVNCALYTNGRIRDIYKLFNHIMIEAKQLSPSVIILHDLDSLISYQKEANVASMKAFQIGENLLNHIEDINKYSSPSISIHSQGIPSTEYNKSVLIIASVIDPSSLDITFLSSDIFHTIFCFNSSENQNQKKKTNNISSTTQHFNNNLDYLYCHLKHIHTKENKLLYQELKSTVLNHCNKWFKYASYHDIKLFVDQCILEFVSISTNYSLSDDPPSLNEIMIEISSKFIPPTMRQTFQSSSNSNNDQQESWDDIGGLNVVKQELLDIFELPTKFSPIFDQLPLKLRSGVLLYGPPGCGKTMIAKCVAKKCGINLISVKGPELLNKYIGASEAAVRDVFMRAKQSSPCIIFFDEFESLAPRRGSESTGVTDRVVNQLLTFLDGVESRSNVFVLAASSRPDLIDVALLRPGRLDKKLFCNIPSSHDRKDIIKRIIINKKINIENININIQSDNDEDDENNLNELVEWIAKETDSFSGADLNMIFTIAQTTAFHRCKNKLMMEMKREQDQDNDNKDQDDDHDDNIQFIDDFKDNYHIQVSITRNDLNDAIKETQINVTASLHQQKQQGLTGTFKSKVDINTIGKKSIQY